MKIYAWLNKNLKGEKRENSINCGTEAKKKEKKKSKNQGRDKSILLESEHENKEMVHNNEGKGRRKQWYKKRIVT